MTERTPTPLSAEELAEMRLETNAAPDISWAVAVSKEFGQRLLATLDAERARADAAEKMYADLLPVAESQYKRVRAAREWLTLALNGECGISNGHLGEESCTTAQIAEVLALLTVEPEAPDA